MMDFVSWDDDIPNWMENWKMFQTTNQCYWSGVTHMKMGTVPLMFDCWQCLHIAFSVHVPVDSVWGNSHPTILNGMKKHITGVYIYIYPPTPADARGSAPGHNTFDPFLTSSSSIAENSRSQTIEVKLDVKLWLSSRISEGTFRPPGSLLLPARN